MPPEKNPISTSSKNRKNSKPAAEKRRRTRMNGCLTELKSLLLRYMEQDENRPNKMEKADILEMTVQHVRHLQRQLYSASANEDSAVVTKHVTGFQECANDVSNYLSSMPEVKPEIQTRLLDHLTTYKTSQPFSNSSSPECLSSSSSTPPLSPGSICKRSSTVENSCLSLIKMASFPPPQSQHAWLAKVSPTESFPPKDISWFDYKNTPSSMTANMTGVTNGILTFDPSHIHESKQKEVQLLKTKMPTSQVAFVFPASNSQQTLPHQNIYMPVPVYAPNPQATLIPLIKSMPSAGVTMTLMADETKPGISVATMTNMTSVPQVISFPGTSSTHLSLEEPISVHSSDIYKQFELAHKNSAWMFSPEIKKKWSLPSVTKDLSRNHMDVHERSATSQIYEENNLWRPW